MMLCNRWYSQRSAAWSIGQMECRVDATLSTVARDSLSWMRRNFRNVVDDENRRVRRDEESSMVSTKGHSVKVNAD